MIVIVPQHHATVTRRCKVVTRPATAGTNAEQEKSHGWDTSVNQLDDFEVIAERIRVTEAIAVLTDRYRQLNQEMTRRETLRWMVP
jgi:hypothetical protein